MAKQRKLLLAANRCRKGKLASSRHSIMGQIYEEHKKTAHFHQWNLPKKGLKYEKVISEEFHYYHNNVLLQNHWMLELVWTIVQMTQTQSYSGKYFPNN